MASLAMHRSNGRIGITGLQPTQTLIIGAENRIFGVNVEIFGL